MHINDNTKTIVPKKNKNHAYNILLQEYLRAKLNDLLIEKDYILACVSKLEAAPKSIDDFWKKKYLSTFFQESSYSISTLSNYPHSKSSSSPDDEALWNNLPYIFNTQYPEQLIYPSISGNKLRSKSEVIIDQTLFFNKIDYRYECQLILNDVILYPDFIALSKSTKQFIIWEHLGLMDDPHYVNNALSKLKLYITNGYIPGINLIITSETNQTPLNPLLVNDYVHRFLM